MEAAEPDGTAVDVPESVVDLLEPYILLFENVADIDPVEVPSDATVPADSSYLVVSRVLDVGLLLRERSG